MSTNQDVKDKINELMDRGMSDKSEIYTMVVKELKVARPTVRRVAGELKNEMVLKVEILGDLNPNGKPQAEVEQITV